MGNVSPGLKSPCVTVRTGLRRVRPLGRTSDRQDGSASAAEGCLNQHKRCPQGLKPFVVWVVNVRAEARTLQNTVLTQMPEPVPTFLGVVHVRAKEFA